MPQKPRVPPKQDPQVRNPPPPKPTPPFPKPVAAFMPQFLTVSPFVFVKCDMPFHFTDSTLYLGPTLTCAHFWVTAQAGSQAVQAQIGSKANTQTIALQPGTARSAQAQRVCQEQRAAAVCCCGKSCLSVATTLHCVVHANAMQMAGDCSCGTCGNHCTAWRASENHNR